MSSVNNNGKEKRTRRSVNLDWLYTNRSFAVISVVLAIVCWALITLYVSDDAKTVITDVPIMINTEDIEQVHELQLISITSPDALTDAKVDVEISGSIYDISRVTADDLTVTAQVGNVTTAGNHLLQLNVTCSVNDVTARVKGGHTFFRAWFDRILQKRVTADKIVVNGVSTTSEEMIIGDYYSSIKSLTIQGPESVVENAVSVLITADVNRALSASEKVAAAISYLDAEGNVIAEEDAKWITILDYNDIGAQEGNTMAGAPADSNITVTVPIRKKLMLPVSVTLKGLPVGFDAGSLTYTVSPDKLSLEGDIDAIEKLAAAGSFAMEGIDLATLSPENRVFKFPLNLSTGIEELSGVTELTVRFDIGGYEMRRIVLENNGSFSFINAEGIGASIISDTLEVVVVGPKRQVEKLEASDFSVSVDMSEYDGSTGQRKMPAIVRIKGTSQSWVYGTYTLTVSTEG